MTLEIVLDRKEILNLVLAKAKEELELPVIENRHYEAEFTGRYGVMEITLVSVLDEETEERSKDSVDVTEKSA